MSQTKAQKVKAVTEGTETLKKNETLIFADFTGVSVAEITKLRRLLREIGGSFKVFKKRLLAIMLKNLGVDLNTKEFEAQMGTVIYPKNISEVASVVYKFSRETATGAAKKERFKILGGLDLVAKRVLPGAEVKMIGQLPPREVLLGQIMGTISGPLRAFLYVLSEKSKQ